MADGPFISPNLFTSSSPLDQLGKTRPTSTAQVDKLSGDFAAEFMSSMLRPMFDSASDNWFGGGESEDVYKTLMVRELGTVLAKSGAGLSVASQVKNELLKIQEVQSAPTTAEPTVQGANQG